MSRSVVNSEVEADAEAPEAPIFLEIEAEAVIKLTPSTSAAMAQVAAADGSRRGPGLPP